jgi:hypothetical protein
MDPFDAFSLSAENSRSLAPAEIEAALRRLQTQIAFIASAKAAK